MSERDDTTKEVAGSGKPKPPNAGKGRPKGSPNKLTSSAKQAFALAFEQIGGARALGQWAAENPTEFYKLFARLIPTELASADPAGLVIRVVRE